MGWLILAVRASLVALLEALAINVSFISAKISVINPIMRSCYLSSARSLGSRQVDGKGLCEVGDLSDETAVALRSLDCRNYYGFAFSDQLLQNLCAIWNLADHSRLEHRTDLPQV